VSRIDEDLLRFLSEDLLRILLAPPKVPAFAKETVRPARPS
jgi:hypothetical protein